MVDKIIDPNVALGAYAKTSNIAKPAVPAGEEEGISFSSFLRQKAEESVETLKTGERMSAAAVTGEANVTDVVQAISASELTLQTIVSVRDRMISAYQDIMRMPI